MSIDYSQLKEDDQIYDELKGLIKYATDNEITGAVELIARAFNLGLQWNHLNSNSGRPSWRGNFDFNQLLNLMGVRSCNEPINVELFSDLISKFDPNSDYFKKMFKQYIGRIDYAIDTLETLKDDLNEIQGDTP